jgi:glycosyltransferase involved in cell wall biosynthesis
MAKKPKVAIVYDWVNQWGGAERVVFSLGKLYPGADLYTAVFDPQDGHWARKVFPNIYPSFLNSLPWSRSKYYLYFPLLPLAFESFDFSRYDLVISVTSFAGKFIITKPATFHLCYCLTPPRFLWERESLPSRLRKFYPILAKLRTADFLTAQRPDYFLATCHNVAGRIKKYYGREAEVVYPGVDLGFFSPAERPREKFFLLVSRLVEYKRIDLVIDAFNHLGWPLKIVCRGRLENKLRQMAKSNIQFLGQLSDERLLGYYRRCRAVIYPQEEDFGLVPLEAQACGTPVIAYGRGGVLETIVPGKTGEFFYQQTVESLVDVLEEFEPGRYLATDCSKNARRFSLEKFMLLFKRKTEEKWQKYKREHM